jgi:S1-C subfamily serine protease
MNKTAIFRLVIASLAIGLIPQILGAGLILQNDYPDEEIAYVIPFTRELNRGPDDVGFNRYFTDQDGKKISVDIRSIVSVVNLPEFENVIDDSSFAALVDKKIELESVAAKVPRARRYLRDTLQALEMAKKNFISGGRKVKGKWLTAAEFQRRQLFIGGVRYSNVELLAVEPTFIRFRYDIDKIAEIAWKRLTSDQINALNSTSQIAHIEADWQQKAEETAVKIAAAEQERIRRLEEEKMERKRVAFASAQNLEKDMRYAEAVELYEQAGAEAELRRVSNLAAVEFEKKGNFAAAEHFFELAGARAEAERVRASHSLSDTEIFKQMAPAVVVVATNDGHGSGFFVHSGGYVITNNHVVKNAARVEIIDNKGRHHAARVLAATSTPDLALLKAEVAEHKVVALGDSSKAQTGDHVVTIGFPIVQNFSATMNQGVISSVDRIVKGNAVLQLDATINHGNSGGPLLNNHCEVIGVTTFGFADFGVDRFNFAIKVSEVRSLLASIPR